MSITMCQLPLLQTENASLDHGWSPGSWSTNSSPETPYLDPDQLDVFDHIQLPLSGFDLASPVTPWCFSDESDCCNASTQSSTNTRRFRKKPARGKVVNSTVVCLAPHCNSTFKRRADLDRHYKHLHSPESVKDRFICDYPKCPRRVDPFHRRDHFRDHLREFHKEDIEKRPSGSSVSSSSWPKIESTASSTSAATADSEAKHTVTSNKLATPKVIHTFNNQAETVLSGCDQPRHGQSAPSELERSWWRCVKCLKRVHFRKDHSKCTHCGGRRRGTA